MSQLPEWMINQKKTDHWHELPEKYGKIEKRPVKLVRRAVGTFAHLFSEIMADDAISCKSGLLQNIDARIKSVSLIGLLVTATFLHSFISLGICLAACLVLLVVTGVPLKRIAGGWLMVPLFSAAIMLPATLNLITDGHPLLIIYKSNNTLISITDAGLIVAARFVLRTSVCVFFALLLTTTTKRTKLFYGLRALGIPNIFVALLNMMQRYLIVLVRTAEEIHLAKISRSIATIDLRHEQAWVASGMGSLFRRTYDLSNQVFLAMISRGYNGEIHLLDQPRIKLKDWCFLACAVIFATLLIIIR